MCATNDVLIHYQLELMRVWTDVILPSRIPSQADLTVNSDIDHWSVVSTRSNINKLEGNFREVSKKRTPAVQRSHLEEMSS